MIPGSFGSRKPKAIRAIVILLANPGDDACSLEPQDTASSMKL